MMEAPGTSDPDPNTCLELSSSGLLHYCTERETEVATAHIQRGCRCASDPDSRTLRSIEWDPGEQPQFLHW